LILPQLVGINQFGFFTAGALLANRLTAIPDGFCTAAYPAMSQACAAGGPGSGRSIMFRYAAIAGTVGIAMAIALTLAAGPISWILFPRHPEPFTTVLRITVWSLPFVAVELVMGYALNAAGNDAAQSRVSVPAAFVSLAISISLVTTLGIIGASLSMLLRPAVRADFLAPLFRKTFHADPEAHPCADGNGILSIYPQPMATRKAG
jgi:O-antigen/teichoic acid export membrane protein